MDGSVCQQLRLAVGLEYVKRRAEHFGDAIHVRKPCRHCKAVGFRDGHCLPALLGRNYVAFLLYTQPYILRIRVICKCLRLSYS